jgi:hypothetical protein
VILREISQNLIASNKKEISMIRSKTPFITLSLLITAALACSLPMLMDGGGGNSIPDGLTENYSPSLGYPSRNPFNYSPDQMTVINTYGNPTRFMIIFTDDQRQETWFYDTTGYSVIFRDGVQIADKVETPEYKPEMYATTLGPNQFYRGMGIDQVVLSTGRNDITLVTLEGLDKPSRLMYLKGLSIGLVNGEVNFVETIPAMTETLLMPEDFSSASPTPPESSHTPELEAALGASNYSMIAFEELAVFDCGSVTTEFYLEGDILIMVEDGEQMTLSPLEENRYSTSIEGVTFTLKFSPTGYVYWGEDSGVLYEVYAARELSDQITIISTPGLSPDEFYNQGTHTYQVETCQAGRIVNNYQTTMENDFPEGQAKQVEAGIPSLYNRLGTNFFIDAEDEIKTLIFTDIGFVWRYEDESDNLFMIFTLIQ